MAAKLEIEVKYQVPADFVLPELAGLPGVARLGTVVEHRLDATYFDTERLRLARHRITLRRRAGGADAGWHLKRPSGADRTEAQAPLTASRQRPPTTIINEVRALIRAEPLRPVARIRTRRRERPLHDAGGAILALLADDDVDSESMIGRRVRRHWRELELELVDGDRALLATVDEALREAGARPADAGSKLAQALADDHLPTDEGGADQDGADRGGAARGGAARGGAAARALGGYLAAQRDAIIEHDPGARAGQARAVHRMRVATRRLRATLRTFGPLLAGDVDRLHDEVAWLTRALGAVRDCDVLSDRLHAAIEAEPAELIIGPVAVRIGVELGRQAATARAGLLAALDSDRYFALLDDLDALVAAEAPRVTRRRLRRLARKALRRADRKFAAATRTGVDEQLHDSRKAYKRARYAVELLRPVAGKRAKRLADAITDLQDTLGGHQDAVVAQRLLRDYAAAAHAAGENTFSYGLLHAREHQSGQDSLHEASGLRRRIGRRRSRGWLDRS
jgi:CHAD domain-containing protein